MSKQKWIGKMKKSQLREYATVTLLFSELSGKIGRHCCDFYTVLLNNAICRNLSGAVELRNNLSSRFSLDLPSTVIFDYPNAQGLASFILSRQNNALGAAEEDTESSQDDDEEEDAGEAADIGAIR